MNLKEVLDNIALLLEAKQVEPNLSGERAALQALAAPANEVPEYHAVLHTQLSLALQLLPQLRAAASELALK